MGREFKIENNLHRNDTVTRHETRGHELIKLSLVVTLGSRRPILRTRLRHLLNQFGMHCSMNRKGNCYERAACPWGAMRRWKVSGARSKTSWCTTGVTQHALGPRMKLPSTSRFSTTANGGIRSLATSPLRCSHNNGNNGPQLNADGVHY